MCEHYVARASEPFRLDELWPFTDRLERYGIAGFGWGAAWLTAEGRLASYRDLRAFRDDPGREALGATETIAALANLRGPRSPPTPAMADPRPLTDPPGPSRSAITATRAPTRPCGPPPHSGAR